MDKSFTRRVKNRIRLAKGKIFITAAFLYVITEYLRLQFEEKFKAYKVLFHIFLFGVAFFLVEPNSGKDKENL